MSRPPKARPRQPSHDVEQRPTLEPASAAGAFSFVRVLEATDTDLPQLDERTVTVLAQPGARRSAWLARELLSALGAEASSGHGRNYTEAQYLAVVRLIAAGTEHIVAVGAADLTAECRDDLIGIAASASCQLWLLHHPGTLDRHDERLLAWTSHIINADELQQITAQPQGEAEPRVAAGLPQLPMQRLPLADWTFQLETIQQETPEALPAVQARWQAVTEQVRAALAAAEPENLEKMLLELVATFAAGAATHAELTIDIRALQAAAFSYGWHVRINLAQLAVNRTALPPSAARTPAMWASLAVYPHPARGAVAALSAAGLNPDQIRTLRCGDVPSQDHHVAAVTTAGAAKQLEAGSSQYVSAQLLYRLGQGATDSDPLFVTAQGGAWARRGITDALGEIARDTGLLLDSRAGNRRAARADSLYTNGVALNHLGPPLPHPEPGVTSVTNISDAASSTPQTLLDTALLRRRRLQLGLSIRGVARLVGVGQTAVRGIEAGTNHESLALGTVTRLGEALGLTLDEMRGGSSGGPAGQTSGHPDAALLGAALFAAGRITPESAIAAALDWTHQRLHTAADGLEPQLPAVGLRFVRRNSQLGIVALEAPAIRAGSLALRRSRLAQDGMNVTAARVLYAAIAHHLGAGGPVDVTSNADRVAAGELIGADLLGADLLPAPAARRGLG